MKTVVALSVFLSLTAAQALADSAIIDPPAPKGFQCQEIDPLTGKYGQNKIQVTFHGGQGQTIFKTPYENVAYTTAFTAHPTMHFRWGYSMIYQTLLPFSNLRKSAGTQLSFNRELQGPDFLPGASDAYRERGVFATLQEATTPAQGEVKHFVCKTLY